MLLIQIKLCPRERNIPEIEIMYEQSFPRLSDRYFKQGPWPVVEAVSDLVDQDHVFCLLYKVHTYLYTYMCTCVCTWTQQPRGECATTAGVQAKGEGYTPATAVVEW